MLVAHAAGVSRGELAARRPAGPRRARRPAQVDRLRSLATVPRGAAAAPAPDRHGAVPRTSSSRSGPACSSRGPRPRRSRRWRSTRRCAWSRERGRRRRRRPLHRLGRDRARGRPRGAAARGCTPSSSTPPPTPGPRATSTRLRAAVSRSSAGDARTALRALDGTRRRRRLQPAVRAAGRRARWTREVAEHDPAVALYGLGADGLEVPRGVTRAAARLLRPGGLYVMEHAEVQAAGARAMVDATGDVRAGGPRPVAGPHRTSPRMVVARRKPARGSWKTRPS